MSKFPRKKEHDRLGASHVNDLSDVAQGISLSQPGSNISGRGYQLSADSPFRQRQYIVVIDHGEIESENSSDSSQSSSSSSGAGFGADCDTRFEIQPRYYDPDSRTWKTDEDEGPYCLDASEFDDDLEVGDLVTAYWNEQRQAYVAIHNPVLVDETISGGDSDCCCNELQCLRIPDHPEITVIPLYYKFIPSTFICGCIPAADARKEARLFSIDNTNLVWESKHTTADDPVMCYGTTTQTQSCTNIATWKWINTPCGSTCRYISVATRLGWQYVSDVCSQETTGCYCDKEPDGFTNQPEGYVADIPCVPGPFTGGGGCGGTCRWVKVATAWAWTRYPGDADCGSGCTCPPPPATPPTATGQEVTRICQGTSENGGWELQGVSDPACNCTPSPPTYDPSWDGTGDNPQAETECTGTKTVNGSNVLFASFWRLTIVRELSAYGCDQTKLEFIIGSSVVLSYHLQRPCGPIRQFCDPCVNTFSLSGPCISKCEDGPTVICLTPVKPNFVSSGTEFFCWGRTTSVDGIVDGVASYLSVTIQAEATDVYCCTDESCTFGETRLAGAAQSINGTHIVPMTYSFVDPAFDPAVSDTAASFEWYLEVGDWIIYITATKTASVPQCRSDLYIIRQGYQYCQLSVPPQTRYGNSAAFMGVTPSFLGVGMTGYVADPRGIDIGNNVFGFPQKFNNFPKETPAPPLWVLINPYLMP